MAGETYHYDRFRSGRIGDFDLPTSGPGLWGKYAALSLQPVRGAPIFVPSQGGSTDSGSAMIIVCTCANEIYAFLENQLLAGSQTPAWSKKFPDIKVPSQRSGSNIPPPIGICGTPVADPAARLLYVLALTDEWNANKHAANAAFYVYELKIDSGDIVSSEKLVDPGAPGRPTFDANVLDQRGALALSPDAGGRRWLYAAFAAFLGGDKGPFHGWVVAVDPANLKEQAYFPLTRTIIGGGVWGPGGAAVGPDGSIYVATGNGLKNDSGDQVEDSYWDDLEGDGKHPPTSAIIFKRS